jgi:hypothetical protein
MCPWLAFLSTPLIVGLAVFLLIGVLFFDNFLARKQRHLAQQQWEAALREARQNASLVAETLRQHLTTVDPALLGRLTLRLSTPQDLLPLQDLEAALINDNQLPQMPADDLSFEACILGPNAHLMVLELEGRILGCCGLSRGLDPLALSLCYWFVHPEWQRKGLGTLVLTASLVGFKSVKPLQHPQALVLSFLALEPTQNYFASFPVTWADHSDQFPGFTYREGWILLPNDFPQTCETLLAELGSVPPEIPFGPPVKAAQIRR